MGWICLYNAHLSGGIAALILTSPPPLSQVRRGSTLRRISMYGALQLAFTAACLAAFIPTYFSFTLALLYQLLKLWFPIYHGSRHQCEKVPNRLLRQALGFVGPSAAGAGGLKLPSHAHVQLLRAHSAIGKGGGGGGASQRQRQGAAAAAAAEAMAGAAAEAVAVAATAEAAQAQESEQQQQASNGVGGGGGVAVDEAATGLQQVCQLVEQQQRAGVSMSPVQRQRAAAAAAMPARIASGGRYGMGGGVEVVNGINGAMWRGGKSAMHA